MMTESRSFASAQRVERLAWRKGSDSVARGELIRALRSLVSRRFYGVGWMRVYRCVGGAVEG